MRNERNAKSDNYGYNINVMGAAYEQRVHFSLFNQLKYQTLPPTEK